MRNEHQANWSPGEVTPANIKLLDRQLTLAREVFTDDDWHTSLALVVRDGKALRVLHLHGEDPAAVHLEIFRLAMQLEADDADAVILTGECWSTPADLLAPYERPSERDDKGEILTVDLLQRNGGARSFSAPIERDGEKVWLGEWSMTIAGHNFSLAPVHLLWKHPISDEWRSMTAQLARAAMAQRQ